MGLGLGMGLLEPVVGGRPWILVGRPVVGLRNRLGLEPVVVGTAGVLLSAASLLLSAAAAAVRAPA